MTTEYRERARRLRNAVEPVAAGVYFATEVHTVYAALGFDGSPISQDGVAGHVLKAAGPLLPTGSRLDPRGSGRRVRPDEAARADDQGRGIHRRRRLPAADRRGLRHRRWTEFRVRAHHRHGRRAVRGPGPTAGRRVGNELTAVRHQSLLKSEICWARGDFGTCRHQVRVTTSGRPGINLEAASGRALLSAQDQTSPCERGADVSRELAGIPGSGGG